MTNPPAGSTTLLFQAPPDLPETDDAAPTEEQPRRSPRQGAPSSRTAGSGSLRMLRGARQAAAGMKLSDDQIRAVLEDPTDVVPDPSQPHRTRLTRDGITVTTGQDGMILRVTRRR